MITNKNPTSIIELTDLLITNKVPENEYKRYFDYYMEMKARKSGTPLHGIFELTPLCNLDCKMCYVHLSNKRFNEENLLSVEVWKKLMLQAHKAGMMNATLTGGECLTYPEFDELYLFLRDKGIVLSVLTNGLLVDEKRINFFKRYPPGLIQISLYGSSDEAYERVTGHRVFNTVYHNIQMLRDANIRVTLMLTPSIFMVNDIRPLVEVAHSLNITYNINSSLVTPREDTGRTLEDLSLDQYLEIYRIRNELNNISTSPIALNELPEENHGGKPAIGLQCGGGRSSFVIKYDGYMSPCPSLSEISSNSLINGFEYAWKEINRLANNYPIPQECVGCVYHDSCITCPAIHKNTNQIGHCDSRICERTKLLIKNGFIELPDNKGGN